LAKQARKMAQRVEHWKIARDESERDTLLGALAVIRQRAMAPREKHLSNKLDPRLRVLRRLGITLCEDYCYHCYYCSH
jgi:hypothetical protein